MLLASPSGSVAIDKAKWREMDARVQQGVARICREDDSAEMLPEVTNRNHDPRHAKFASYAHAVRKSNSQLCYPSNLAASFAK
jgi:hypothetical protein